MQAFAGIANQVCQTAFDVHMHIFQSDRPVEPAVIDFFQNLHQSPLDVRQVLFSQDFLRTEHFGMGKGALDVESRHALVKGHGCRITLDEFIDRLRETARPDIVFSCRFLVHHKILFGPVILSVHGWRHGQPMPQWRHRLSGTWKPHGNGSVSRHLLPWLPSLHGGLPVLHR